MAADAARKEAERLHRVSHLYIVLTILCQLARVCLRRFVFLIRPEYNNEIGSNA